MPWIAFVDEELTKELEKISNKNSKESVFPEHEFLGTCLRIGLHVSDLEKLTYVDTMKILITYINYEEKPSSKKATQSDIDKLLI